MKCPTCNAWAVVKQMQPRDHNVTYRRYECGNLHRFNTYERTEISEAQLYPKQETPTIGGQP